MGRPQGRMRPARAGFSTRRTSPMRSKARSVSPTVRVTAPSGATESGRRTSCVVVNERGRSSGRRAACARRTAGAPGVPTGRARADDVTLGTGAETGRARVRRSPVAARRASVALGGILPRCVRDARVRLERVSRMATREGSGEGEGSRRCRCSSRRLGVSREFRGYEITSTRFSRQREPQKSGIRARKTSPPNPHTRHRRAEREARTHQARAFDRQERRRGERAPRPAEDRVHERSGAAVARKAVTAADSASVEV